MNTWFDPADFSRPVITAQRHVTSRHGSAVPITLPPVGVLFEMGRALDQLTQDFTTEVIADRLPCFLDNPPCLRLKDHPQVCFTKGGYGAPAAVDTLETLLALGVKKVIIAGLCGVFDPRVQVGDVVIPTRIHSEEGTSRHYALDATWAFAHPELCAKLREAMRKTLEVKAFDTVTTDAVYRQTLNKEAYWRSLGCVGVDMEASALLQVCACYHVPAAAALLVSDGHPLSESEGDWDWGSVDFAAVRRQYIHQIVEVSVQLAQRD